MHEVSDILISVDERHVQNMLNGTKTIELRRRAVRIPKGSKVWIYSKIPVGEVCAYGIVDKVVEASPKHIWNNYGHLSGISYSEFNEYFSDKEAGCAIMFASIQKLQNKISLSLIREKLDTFTPPQFFKYLNADSKELAFFQDQQCMA